MASARIELGPFVLDRLIGKGGMAEIWSGTHAAQQVPVAVKVITELRAREHKYRRAFKNEVQAVARLHHPGIILVLDHGEADGRAERQSEGRIRAESPYLVMELASWGSLDRVRTPLPFGDLASSLLSLLDALGHAHARGVIHRDLKPGNVLMSGPTDIRPGLKVTDFGIAHALETTGDGFDGDGGGTPHFMAPEQFMGHWRDYGPWTDLYSVGCLAYRLATGKFPFQGEHAVQLAWAHVNKEVPEMKLRQDTPPAFEAWVRRLLQKRPEDRFQRAADAAWSLMQLVELRSRHTRDRPAPAMTRREAIEVPTRPDPPSGDIIATPLEDLIMSFRAHGVTSLDSVGFDPLPPTDETRPMSAASFVEDVTVLDEPLVRYGDEADPRTVRSLANARIESQGGSPAIGLATLVHPTQLGVTLPWMLEANFKLDVTFGPGADAAQHEQLAPRRPPPLPSTWRRAEDGEGDVQLLGAGLGLFALRTIPLVDREEARDHIWNALEGCRADRAPQLVLLHGGAGYGKSRLAAWMSQRADEVGSAIVLRADHEQILGSSDALGRMISRHLRCVGLTRPEVHARLEKLFEATDDESRYELLALTELISPATLADEGQGGAIVQFGSAEERHALLQRFLKRLTVERPVILWLDDVQWGSDSVAFAEHLLGQSALPVLIMMTARSEVLHDTPELEARLSQIMRRPNARTLEIGRLAEADHEKLIRELLRLDEGVVEEVVHRTAGNPLFAIQLVGDWIERGALTASPDGFRVDAKKAVRVPDDIHQLWSERIAQVLEERDERETWELELAAVFGEEVDLQEWRAALRSIGLELDHNLVDTLVGSGLVSHNRGSMRFTHGMLRDSLLRNAAEGGRYRDHQRVAAATIEATYPRNGRLVAERIGHHLLEAGDKENAFDYLMQGARVRVQTSRYPAARALIGKAGQILEDIGAGPGDPRRGQVWLLSAREAILTGDLGRAHSNASRTEDHARRFGWRRELPTALEILGNVALDQGDADLATETFAQARYLYTWNENPHGVINCLSGAGSSAYRSGRHDEAETHYQEGLELAEATKDARGTASHLSGLGFVALWRGQRDQALTYFRRELKLLEEVGSRYRVARCVSALGEVARQANELEQAERHYRRALTIHEAIGSNRIWGDRTNLALVQMARGEFEAALESMKEVIADLGDSVKAPSQLIVHVALLPGLAETQAWPEWDAAFATAAELIRSTKIRDGDVAGMFNLAGKRAEHSGDPVRARHAYEASVAQWRGLNRKDRATPVEAAIARLGRR